MVKEDKLNPGHQTDMMFIVLLETNGVITYHRRQIEDDHFPRWHRSEALIKKLFVTRTGTIEDDGKYMLQMDFANKLADN